MADVLSQAEKRKAKSGDFLALEVAHIFPVAQLEMVLYSH
jgi:hypothetical protein